VLDTVLLPGTGFVGLALAAGAQVGCEVVEELVLEAPLVVPERGWLALQVLVREPDRGGRRELVIYSRVQDGGDEELSGGEWTRHAGGVISPVVADGEEVVAALAAESWPPVGAEPVEVEFVYDRLAEAGFGYGPAFQGLGGAWRRGEEIFAEVSLAEEQAGQAERFGIHPALFDAALHGVFLGGDDLGLRLPFSWAGVRLFGTGATSLRVRIVPCGVGAMSLAAVDEVGRPVLWLDSLEIRPLDPDQAGLLRQGHDSLFSVEWSELAGESGEAGRSEVVVLGGMELGGVDVERYPDLGALVDAIDAGVRVPELVLVPAPEALESEGLVAAAHRISQEVLALLQGWLAQERLPDSRLAVLTTSAVAVTETEAPALREAPLWGLMRSAQSEHPGRFGLIDFDGTEVSRATLPAALATGQPQLAIRHGKFYVPQLTRVADGASLAPPAGESMWRLEAGHGGTLEGLSLTPSPEAGGPLRSGQVRVAIYAAGVNFRDVLLALNVYPGEASVGSEGAGIVLEVGPGVADLAVGDRVMGLFSNAFGPVAITNQQTVVRVPEGWSFAQAASVPVVFLTAYYGLVDMAQLESGETLLVHAAAGGVGMAAVQLARHLGANVFATASPSKWEQLRRWDIDDSHLASSRTLEFKEKVLDATSGRGVDVVMNALVREFVDASLALLPRGGRFIELGKLDVRDPEAVGREHPGVCYRAFDLTEVEPERIQEMLSAIVRLFENGALQHLPVTAWDIRHGVDAFRFLRDGRHVGKIVLTVPQVLDSGGTVLVTGGTGGLGALVARDLAERGAERLVLVSRRGGEAEGAQALRAGLAELGCEARLVACDVADREQLAGLLDSIPAEFPLTGVVHAAGVLEDGVIETLDAQQLDRVLRPKLDAAVLLDELTERAGVREFVLFSSAAAALGSPGQGNYAAANAFLDALARHRRARGLPAVSLAWGLWAPASGMTGGLSETDRSRMARAGMLPLSERQGLELFELGRSMDQVVLLPMRLDGGALRAQARDGLLSPLLRGLVRVPARRAQDAAGSLARRLVGMPQSEWEGVVLELVRAEIAVVLGHMSSTHIDPDVDFLELGFDSLAALELRNRLTTVTGLRLPPTLTFDYRTANEIASHVIKLTDANG
jgi:NADPH:quinone reductase-like Zn-dependent oxidoreductase/acyl carrier protein